MRSTFMGFEGAKSAIYVNQKALDIVAHNLANVDTPGYTRQAVERESLYPFTSSARVATNSISLLGQGVDALGVSQTRDAFLDKRFRDEYSSAAYYGKSAEILADIQNALGDGANLTDEDGLFSAITQIFESINSFIQEPTMESQANIVMSSFQNITQILNQLDNNLATVTQRHIEDLQVDVAKINDLTSQIAHLNKVISEDSVTINNNDNDYFYPNELMDQRNLLLDELSSYGNLDVIEYSDGTVDVLMGSQMIIKGTENENLMMRVDEDNLTVDLRWQGQNNILDITGGTLLSSLHYLNGSGNNLAVQNGEPYEGVVYYRNLLDTFASALTQVANNTIPEADANGDPLLDADGNIVYKTLLGAKLDDGTTSKYGVSSSNISLSSEWTNAGSGYFIYDNSEYVVEYSQLIAVQLTETDFTFNTYGEEFTGSFSDFHINIISNLGSQVSFNEGRRQSYALIADDFLNQRDSISGVSSDEETANMLTFQKSYEAAARVMTTMDEMLDVVINRMGRVGL